MSYVITIWNNIQKLPFLWYTNCMKIEAHAKVNLILNVLGKRPDGYHEVENLMQSIDLHDDVDVEVTGGHGIWISCTGARMRCDQTNLAYKAAELMQNTFKKDGHINIGIEKRIPIAAGLGGGSSDAAAVINALAKIWEIDDEEKLLELGAKLGADVPFCIASQRGKECAIARGIGTELEFVESPKLKVELKVLDIHIKNKTKTVYAELKPEDYAVKYDIQKFLDAKSVEEKEALMGNHLQAPAIRVFERAGYSVPKEPKHLSGAGPTLFSIVK